MRVVTDRAVLGWFMLADEGAPLFHVTGKAGIGNAVALHQLGAGGAMRGVAIGTGDLAFENRVVGLLVDQAALLLMAGEADLRLGTFVLDLVVGRVQLVTGCAGNIACRVRAARPVDELAALVAAGTDFVVATDLVLCLLAEREGRFWPFLFAFRLVDVGFAIAVTADATGQTAIGTGAMSCLANTENLVTFILVVTLGALGVTVENKSFADLCFIFISLCQTGESGKCKTDYAQRK